MTRNARICVIFCKIALLDGVDFDTRLFYKLDHRWFGEVCRRFRCKHDISERPSAHYWFWAPTHNYLVDFSTPFTCRIIMYVFFIIIFWPKKIMNGCCIVMIFWPNGRGSRRFRHETWPKIITRMCRQISRVTQTLGLVKWPSNVCVMPWVLITSNSYEWNPRSNWRD